MPLSRFLKVFPAVICPGRSTLLLLLLAATPLWTTTSTGASSRWQSPGVSERCSGTLDGSRFPELIPDAFPWNALWARATDPATIQLLKREIGIDDTTVTRLRGAAAHAGSLHQVIRRGGGLAAVGLQNRFPVAPELEAQAALSEVSLDTRDQLISTLTEPEFRKLNDWIKHQRQRSRFDFGMIGFATPPDVIGRRTCRISVSGAKRPDLIPESYYWEAYFTFIAAAAERHVTEYGSFSKEYLVVQQKHHLPMPLSDIELLLSTALRTTRLVNELRSLAHPSTEADSLRLRLTIADTISEHRASLLRALPDSSAAAVKRDASNTRAGSTYDFPPMPVPGK